MPQIIRRPLTLTAPGQQLELTQFVYNQGGSPVVYLQAGIHADEYPAMAALEQLRVQLDGLEDQLVGEVRLVPIANPGGLTQFFQTHHQGRYEMDSGENFNRAYPDLLNALVRQLEPKLGGSMAQNDALIRAAIREQAKNFKPVSLNQEHKATLFEWACDADYVLDVHCDDVAELHLYASRRAQKDLMPLAQALKATVVMLADDSGGSSFDEAAPGLWAALAERFPDHPIGMGCRGCTVELRGQADVSQQLAVQDAQGMLAYLRQIGVLAGQAEISPHQPHLCDLESVDLVPAPVAGLVEWAVPLGSQVEPGQVIARIMQLGGQGAPDTHAVTARNKGRLFTRVHRPYVRAGQTLVKIAGDEPLSWRSGYLLGD